MLRRVLFRGLTATVLAVGAVIGGAGPAGAHAAILGTEPRYGASLATAPDRVLVRYDLPVEVKGAQVSLTRSGRAVRVGLPQFGSADRKDVSLPLPKLSPAPYVLTWFLFGSDGDVMGGELTFTVRPTGPDGLPVVGPSPDQAPPTKFAGVSYAPLSRAQDAARLAASASLAVLVGGVAFVAGLWWAGAVVPRVRLILWTSLTGALMANAAALGLKGAAVQGRSALSALSPSAITALDGTHVGKVLMTRLGLLVLAVPIVALMTMAPERALNADHWYVAAVASGLGALATHGWLSHAWNEGLLAFAAHVIHLTAISVWLGGLVILAAVVLPRRQAGELAELVPAFSRLAFRSVATAMVAGGALLLLISPRWSALPSSAYGQALLVKLALVAGLLVAASRARGFVRQHVLVPAAAAATAAGPSDAVVEQRPFVSAVLGELCIAASILTATAFLVGRAPPS